MLFRSGPNLATTNDSQSVTSISTANPAVVTLANVPTTWVTGDLGFFTELGTGTPLLQGRRFILTILTTGAGGTLSIQDEITQDNINGSTLDVSSLAATAIFNHVTYCYTPWYGSMWTPTNLRFVQTETAGFFLNSQTPPQELIVTALPTDNSFASFDLTASFFEDGPYLDPIPGSIITPSGTSGIITLTAGFQPWSSTQAYTLGDFVEASSIGYESIADANVDNTPSSAPTFWKVVGLGAAINNGQGFLASDIGRLVRLFSEPALWSSTTTYATGNIVTYNPSSIPGYETYYSSLTNTNVGNIPGTDATHWSVVAIGSSQNPAIWTWGKITALSTEGLLAQNLGTAIGNLTSGGGLAAAFNSANSQALASSATTALDGDVTANGYVGKNFGSGETISQVVVYAPFDTGFSSIEGGNAWSPVTLYLYGSNSSPSSATNGTLLGSLFIGSNTPGYTATILSNSGATTYQYVWVYVSTPSPFPGAQVGVAQLYFYTDSASPGTAVSCEILGPPLLYSETPIQTWRLGLYSNTTGWPNVGTYSDGRLWLSGPSYPNRFDACVANGIAGINNGNVPGSVNFAPTDQFGNVLDSSAIDYTINAPGANGILWMLPTLQGIILGTQAGECLITAPTAGGISPTNISARFVTKIGSANVQAIGTEHTYVFVQRYSVKLMEYFADIFSGKFTAPNLADKAQHITSNGIAEIAYTHSATPIVWGYDTDGNLFGCTYKRDTLMTSQGPTYYGWHRHQLADPVISLCSGPSIGGDLDAVTVVTTDGDNNFVEIMTDQLDELATLDQSMYLDRAIIASSSVTSSTGVTLNGLWDHNGKTVGVFAASAENENGLDLGTYTVSNGSLTIPFGDGVAAGAGGGLFTAAFAATVSQYVCGFPYTSQGQLVRPQDPVQIGTRLGPGLGKIRQLIRASALFSNLGLDNTYPITGYSNVQIGASFGTLLPVIINAATTKLPDGVDTLPTNQLSTYSDIWRDSVKSEADYDGRLCWQVTGALPCNIAAIEVWCRGEDGP